MIEKNFKKFTKEEVEKECLKYFNGDELATSVWINKYCLKDENNLYELTPDDMHVRIANELARIESRYPNPRSYDDIYDRIKQFKRIVPQGSPMAGIGNNFQTTSLSNCFVVGNKKDCDSYGGILKIDQELVQLQKRRGGVGTDLSFIRPAGSPVKNSAITSTGVVPFMKRYSSSTNEVAQDGRRGALMLSISVQHIDAESFIDAKLQKGQVTGANISVKINDEFMKAVLNKEPYLQKYPIDIDVNKDDTIINIDDMEYNKIYKGALGLYKKIDAEKLWKKIIHNAWASAEPGILFWDTIISESIPDCYIEEGFKTISTNPCGEIMLCPNDSCRLLLLNLFGYVINPFTKDAKFNWNLFKEDVIEAQRYMDDIIDLELEKIDKILEKIESDPEDEFIKMYEVNLWKEIKNMALQGRRTGLGVTGEGDMLAALGLTYGTDEATDFSVSVHKTLKLSAYRSSVELAKERGCFPVFNKDKEINNPFLLRIKEENLELYNDIQIYGRRNIALLTISPAGSVSICTQTTSGIEPAFMVLYKRRRKINPQEKNARVDFVDDEGVAWMEYPVFHKNFELWLKVNGYDIDTVKTMNDIQLDEIIKKSPYYKGTAHDINWVKKVEMQGKIQKNVDHSISMTTNIPKDTTEEVVSKIYETGWKFGCKGVTIYRDGSRAGVLVSNNEPKKEDKLTDTYAPKRPKRLKGKIHRFQNNLEKWIAVVGLKDGRPYEIFTGKLENGLSNLPPNIEDCEVVKNIVDAIDENGDKIKKKRYDIEYVDADGIKHTHTGLNHAFNPEFWNYAKFISGILRHGMPLVYVVELIGSLNFKEDYINTWKNGVMRTLKKYIADGSIGSGVCPICGSDHLEYKEGCLTCMSCGNSKCN